MEVSNFRPHERAGYGGELRRQARRGRIPGVRGVVSPKGRDTGGASPEDKSCGRQVGVKPARLPFGGLRV